MNWLAEYRAKRTIWRYWNRRITQIGRRLRESCVTDEEMVG